MTRPSRLGTPCVPCRDHRVTAPTRRPGDVRCSNDLSVLRLRDFGVSDHLRPELELIRHEGLKLRLVLAEVKFEAELVERCGDVRLDQNLADFLGEAINDRL